MSWQILVGDCRERLAELPEQSVQTVCTSPPYFGLRDYGHDGQIGLEPSPDEFVAALVAVFREVRRILRDDGTVWLNLGDSYATGGISSLGRNDAGRNFTGGGGNTPGSGNPGRQGAHRRTTEAKPKDLLGIPWMVAFALRADGWYLRSDIIWAKPNPMPEAVTDRPTKAHEYVFLLSKRARYFYDANAIREVSDPAQTAHNQRYAQPYDNEARIAGGQPGNVNNVGIHSRPGHPDGGRNKRSVWTVASQPFSAKSLGLEQTDHFATFPSKLIEPCVLAGSRPGDTVLDPFAGAGTTGMVALRHNRSFIGIEMNPEYAELARRRIVDDAPLLNSASERAA